MCTGYMDTRTRPPKRLRKAGPPLEDTYLIDMHGRMMPGFAEVPPGQRLIFLSNMGNKSQHHENHVLNNEADVRRLMSGKQLTFEGEDWQTDKRRKVNVVPKIYEAGELYPNMDVQGNGYSYNHGIHRVPNWDTKRPPVWDLDEGPDAPVYPLSELLEDWEFEHFDGERALRARDGEVDTFFVSSCRHWEEGCGPSDEALALERRAKRPKRRAEPTLSDTTRQADSPQNSTDILEYRRVLQEADVARRPKDPANPYTYDMCSMWDDIEYEPGSLHIGRTRRDRLARGELRPSDRTRTKLLDRKSRSLEPRSASVKPAPVRFSSAGQIGHKTSVSSGGSTASAAQRKASRKRPKPSTRKKAVGTVKRPAKRSKRGPARLHVKR